MRPGFELFQLLNHFLWVPSTPRITPIQFKIYFKIWQIWLKNGAAKQAFFKALLTKWARPDIGPPSPERIGSTNWARKELSLDVN